MVMVMMVMVMAMVMMVIVIDKYGQYDLYSIELLKCIIQGNITLQSNTANPVTNTLIYNIQKAYTWENINKVDDFIVLVEAELSKKSDRIILSKKSKFREGAFEIYFDRLLLYSKLNSPSPKV